MIRESIPFEVAIGKELRAVSNHATGRRKSCSDACHSEGLAPWKANGRTGKEEGKVLEALTADATSLISSSIPVDLKMRSQEILCPCASNQ